MARRSDQNSGAPAFVSARQVAEHAGVSRSAVSRTFTPGASVSPVTREKVLQAAEELGYQVNHLARGLLASHSRLVGLVVTNPELGFRSHLVAALTRALIGRGSIPFMINTGNTGAEIAAAQAAAFGYRAEATIILSGSPPSSFVDLARRNGQPLIMIGRTEPGFDHVHIDNEGAARRAAAFFVKQGLYRLGLASSASGTPSIVERERAFVAEAGRLGASVVLSRGRDSDYAGGLEAGLQLLDSPERPQAVFCVNDLIAFGFLDIARNRFGIRVPDEISVIGFDDIPEAAWGAYDLTTFRQDPGVIAAKAVELLERRSEEPSAPPAIVTLSVPLVERRSTGACP